MMRSKIARFVVLAATGAAVLAASVSPVSAAPVFARKYGFNCTMCHSNFPRLNDFGQRYRANGYRLPGRENLEKTVLETPAPVAIRTSAGYNVDKFRQMAGADGMNVSQFEVNGLDVLSGGLLGPRIGYFMVMPPEIKSDKGVAGQDGTIEMASLVFSHLGSSWLNVRAGRFEPAYVAFSVKRTLSASPYEMYEQSFPGGPAFASTQDGVEVTGHGSQGWSYAAGWLDGSAGNQDDDVPADFYVRAAKVFGAGEGQTAGHRLGLVAYSGRARPDPPGSVAGREDFQLYGADASLNFGHMNLVLQWLLARYDKSLWGAADRLDFNGGFAEVSFLPATNFVGFARYDLVNTPDEVDQDLWRLTVGGRFYFVDQAALHLEYSHRAQKPGAAGGADQLEDFATARLDFAF